MGVGLQRRARAGVASVQNWDRPAKRALCIAALSLVAYLVVRWFFRPTMIDLAVYRVEGDAVRRGLNLYSALQTPLGLRATYPPFAAILFVPFSIVTFAVSEVVVTAANIVLLAYISHQSCRLAGVSPQRRVEVTLLMTAASFWAEPVFTTLRYGQINLALLALIMWDFLRPESARTRGIGIGIAAGIKVTPAIFIVYLVLTRRYRMAATAVGAFAATVAFSAVIVPSATWKFWTNLLFDTSRVGRLENAANQSLRGLAVRISHSRDTAPGWTLLVGLVIVVGLACAVFAYRRLGDAWGVPACAVTGMIGAPIAWSHHWVWCIPITVLLWQQCRRWLPSVLIFWTFAVWFLPHKPDQELHFAVWQIALSTWYVVFGVLFLGLAAVLAHRAGTSVDRRSEERV